MMGTRFWEELPESKVENGNNNRKIHSAYLTVLYQETKVVTLQSCIKPVIRMVRPMEVERGDVFQVTASNAGVGTAEEENRFEYFHCLEPTTL